MSSSGGGGGGGSGDAAAAAAGLAGVNAGATSAADAATSVGGTATAPGSNAPGGYASFGSGVNSDSYGYSGFGQSASNVGDTTGYSSVSSDKRGTVSATSGSDTGMGSLGSTTKGDSSASTGDNAYGNAVGNQGFVGQSTGSTAASTAGSGFGSTGGFGTNSIGDAQGITGGGGKSGLRVGGGFANTGGSVVSGPYGTSGGASSSGLGQASAINPISQQILNTLSPTTVAQATISQLNNMLAPYGQNVQTAQPMTIVQLLLKLGLHPAASTNMGWPAMGATTQGTAPLGVGNQIGAATIGTNLAPRAFGPHASEAIASNRGNAAVNQGIATDRGIGVTGFPYGVNTPATYNPNTAPPGLPDPTNHVQDMTSIMGGSNPLRALYYGGRYGVPSSGNTRYK